MLGFVLIALAACVTGTVAQDPTGRCDCSLFTTTLRNIPGDDKAGPLWLIEHDNDTQIACGEYLSTVCYVFCEAKMTEWLEEYTDLDVVVDIEAPPGQFTPTVLGQFMCDRSYVTFPGNPDNYDGVRNAPLLLAARIDVGSCRPWTVYKDYPERKLCCDAVHRYYPTDSCPWGPGEQ